VGAPNTLPKLSAMDLLAESIGESKLVAVDVNRIDDFLGSAELEPLPMPKNALAIIQKLVAGTEPKRTLAAQSA
jgi:hypothetical protein